MTREQAIASYTLDANDWRAIAAENFARFERLTAVGTHELAATFRQHAYNALDWAEQCEQRARAFACEE